MRVTTVNIPIQRLEQLFYAFDLNMDSYIDASELATLIDRSYTLFEHTLTMDSWSALVRTLALHMDINSDGMLAISEVMSAFSQI
jgi:Ca2+-binding EF-hand superfamily protein